MQKLEQFTFYLFILLLPTQLGKHFWPSFTIVSGIRIDYLSPIVYVTDVLLILLFGFFVFRTLRKLLKPKSKIQKSKLKSKNRRRYVVGSFVLLFLIITVVFSSRPFLSLYGLVKLGECIFLVIYIAQTITSRFQLRKIALFFAFSSLFESLLAIAQYIHQGSLNGIFYYFGERTFTGMTPGIANASIGGILILRPYGTFPHPNVLAGYLLVVMVLVWNFLFKTDDIKKRILATVSLLLSSVALLLTFSRIAIFIWVLVLLFLFLRFLLQTLKSARARFVASILLIVSLTFISMFPITHDVILRFSHLSFSDETVVERIELLRTASVMLWQHPLSGVGLYNFIPAMAPLQKPLPLGLYLQPVHNIFVLVAAETGIIGFGLFVWLFAATILRIKTYNAKYRNALLLLLLVIFVTGMFDHYWLTLQQGQLILSIIFGFSWSSLQKEV